MKPPAKSVAQRAVGGTRRILATKPTVVITKKPPVGAATKKVGKRAVTVSPPQKLRQLPQRTTHTRSSAAIGTRSSYQQQGTTTSKQAPPIKAPTIKLKIGKDRLREVTSAWTPPPGATDTGAPSTAAGTPESIAAPIPTSTSSMPRGRKVVQEDSDDEEEDEDEEDDEEEESKMGEERDPEDELGDEDAEGETDDEMLDSDDETGATPGTDFMSRTGTPDMSRLTNRQRTRLGDITTADLLELPSGFEKPGANKAAVSLSVQEQELKRAEMARRRKNLTDQKLEEEKIDTINRLLKKQTPKMRGRSRATGDATPADQGGDTIMGGVEQTPPPAPTMVRWVSNKDGIRLAVPGSWLAAPVGKRFEPQTETERMRNVRRKLVEEL
ncbi:hypothetical protein K440DRAFT_391065 [Wilcoxina mikolae CBS 423.85]|nr:hypothetical protein K440DRAFT_391065 [Wilcoxina mikolae CBS 423.85]